MAEIFKDLLRFCKILTDLHGWDSYQILEDLGQDFCKGKKIIVNKSQIK